MFIFFFHVIRSDKVRCKELNVDLEATVNHFTSQKPGTKEVLHDDAPPSMEGGYACRASSILHGTFIRVNHPRNLL